MDKIKCKCGKDWKIQDNLSATDRLVSLLKHEASNHGQCDYKHEAAARLEEITSKLAESERHRQILTQQNAELVRRVKALEATCKK